MILKICSHDIQFNFFDRMINNNQHFTRSLIAIGIGQDLK